MYQKRRIFIFCLIVFCTQLLKGQIFQDFSSSSAYNLDLWSGNKTHFTVENNALHLKQNGQAGTSYLSIPLSVQDTMQWEFQLLLDFNPSAYNFALLSLMSDTDQIRNSTNGIFVQLGGKDDAIILYHKENNQYHRIITCNNRLNAKSNKLKIQIRKNRNNWILESLINEETSFTNHGEATYTPPKPIGPQAFLGFICQYTKTYGSKFYFYRIIQKENIDQPDLPSDEVDTDTIILTASYKPIIDQPNKKLEIDSCNYISPDKLALCFNRHVYIKDAVFHLSDDSYTLSPHPTQYPHIVQINLNKTLDRKRSFTLFWHNVKDRQLNILDFGAYQIVADETEQGNEEENTEKPISPPLQSGRKPIEWAEIQITEIMANPKGIVLLPEVEYIELYNNTTDTLDMTGAIFCYGTNEYGIDTSFIAPHTYAILCNRSKVDLFQSSTKCLTAASFPVLANTGKLIQILNEEKKIIHFVNYSDTWYKNSYAKEGGYALEVINPTGRSSDENNWQESTAVAGGTPGEENKVINRDHPLSKNYIKAAYAIEPGLAGVYFNKSLLPFAEPSQWFSGDDLSQTEYTCLNPPFHTHYLIRNKEKQEIQINECFDIDQQELYPAPAITFDLANDIIEKKDIIINELYLSINDETPAFIELYNTTTKTLDLFDLLIKVDGNSYQLVRTPTYIHANQYVVICSDIDLLFQQFTHQGTPQLISFELYPSGDLTQATIQLISKKDSLIDQAYYFDFASSQITQSGYSSQRTHFDADAMLQSSWSIGSTPADRATPGRKNSVSSSQHIVSDTTKIFSLLYPNISLDKQQPESCLTLNYHLDTKEYYLSALLYTRSGIKVAELANNTLITQNGQLHFEQQWRNDRSKTPGLYILLLRLVQTEGYTHEEKLIIPITP